MIKIKHPKQSKWTIPNLLSMLRILLVFCLYVLAYYQLQTTVVVVLIIAFLTDFFDGLIARKWNLSSETGAKLDSIADYFTFLSLPIIVYLIKPLLIIQNLSVIGLLVVFYLSEQVFGYILHHKFISLHLYSSKINTVLISMFTVYILIFDFNKIFFSIVYFSVILCIIEDISIQIIYPKIRVNMKSFFYKLDTELAKKNSLFLVINALIMFGISMIVYLFWLFK